MSSNKYIKVFNDIFKKVKELSDKQALQEHLLNRSKLRPADLDDRTIFKRLAAVILSSGFNATVVKNRWPALKKAFKDFDFKTIKDWDSEKVKDLMKNRAIIRNRRKIEAIIFNASRFNEIIEEFGNFNLYIESFNSQTDLYHDIHNKFQHIGQITAFDFLKRIGLDFIKPDIHIRRLFFRLGWLETFTETEKNFRDIIKIAEQISEETGRNLNYIDGVFWLFCSGYGDIMSKGICGSKPLCDECYVLDCRYRKEVH